MPQDAPAETQTSGVNDNPVPKSKPLRPRRFVSYETALKYLDSHTNVERSRPAHLGKDVFKLDRMRAILKELGNPQHEVRFVHVAGSKGKGSIVEMVASCLGECGYGVGVYTSPHLISVRERVRIGVTPISKADFVRELGYVAVAAAAVEKDHGPATYFELITAVAFRYFAEKVVDIAVIEVGLGGRLDSTNVITPECGVLGAIHLEHTQILGETIELIAREKAGIMKPGVTTFTYDQGEAVMGVFRKVAEEVGAELKVIGEDLDFTRRFESTPERGPHMLVCLSTEHSNHEHLPVPLPGLHQATNCGLALAVLDKLGQMGFETGERPVAVGLAKTQRLGRLEQVYHSPRIYIDGAHTAESIHALVKAIGAHIRYDSMVVVFGCAADKDIEGIVDKIGLGADKIIFTKSSTNPRSMDPDKLQRMYVERHGKMAMAEPNLKKAINIASKAVGLGQENLILVTGSFYLAGEAKGLFLEKAVKDKAASEVEGKGT